MGNRFFRFLFPEVALCPCFRSRTVRLSFSIPLLLSATAALSAQSIAELQKLASAGDPQSQFRLGIQYALGQDVPRDMPQALFWYRKAADQGNGEAQYNLAVAYHNGLGVSRDEAESVRWYPGEGRPARGS